MSAYNQHATERLSTKAMVPYDNTTRSEVASSHLRLNADFGVAQQDGGVLRNNVTQRLQNTVGIHLCA